MGLVSLAGEGLIYRRGLTSKNRAAVEGRTMVSREAISVSIAAAKGVFMNDKQSMDTLLDGWHIKKEHG